MSSQPRVAVLQQDPILTAAITLLDNDSHTAQRLRHADAEHLHLTTRRCFVGPIPEGWLKSHRKQWYRHYLGIHHASQVPTFSAQAGSGSHRRMTGIDAPHAGPSFPQPADALDGAAESSQADAFNEETHEMEATTRALPGLPVARSRTKAGSKVLRQDSDGDVEQPVSSLDQDTAEQLTPNPARRSIGDLTSSRPRFEAERMQSEASMASFKTAQASLTRVESTAIADSDSDQPPSAGPSSETPIGISIGNTEISKGQQPDKGPGSLNLPAHNSPALSGRAGSTASLLPIKQDYTLPAAAQDHGKHITGRLDVNHCAETEGSNLAAAVASGKGTKNKPGRSQVQFDLPDQRSRLHQIQERARMAQIGLKTQGRINTPTHGTGGEIIRMEKMLLRVDQVTGADQPDADFGEKDSLRVETRVLEKWREFMVVCRETSVEGANVSLQMYQSRVIPASDKGRTKKRFKHEVLLDKATVRVNLYSALDKTIAVSARDGPKTRIYFLRTRSGTSAVEWYHFLRSSMNMRRAKTIQITIPDLNASVRLDNPFDRLENDDELEMVADGNEEALIKASMSPQSAVAQRIIRRCLDILAKNDGLNDVLDAWSHHDRVTLAWKRYDRIEWVFGQAEIDMYGANTMLRTHQLELRTKQHYPQHVRKKSGKELSEPAPVEGFLIRLTTQKGAHQRMGKYFFKRLYFSTHNQFLFFLRPAKAQPPAPPTMPLTHDSDIPSVDQLSGKIPLIFAVNPYPLRDGAIPWLTKNDAQAAHKHDVDAADETQRVINTIHNSDGFINLCDVLKVRKFHPDATAADEGVKIGSDVDYDMSASDTDDNDGSTSEVDADRTLELVLRNGLVIRLQAFSRATKQEWIKRLRDLVRYWTHRAAADMNLFKSVRSENLSALNIDERAEAHVGQFAQKWEITRSFASPQLYHLCGLSQCRAVHVSGELFRKPRLRATFGRCYVVLCRGHLLIFQDALRSRTGKRVPHVHHERIASIDLSRCYLYSGLLTGADLPASGPLGGAMSATQDVGSTGSTALPRMFLDDQWTSTDEDAMTTFVLWHGQRKGWFRSSETDVVRSRSENGGERDGGVRSKATSKLKRVNALGVKGRSVVFKARSRAERDHWVLAIAAEIEHAARDDGVRVVGKEEVKK